MNLVEGGILVEVAVEVLREKQEKDFYQPQIGFRFQIGGLIPRLESKAEMGVQITFRAVLSRTFQPQKVTLQPAGSVHPLYKAWTWLLYHHAKDLGTMGLEPLIIEIWMRWEAQETTLGKPVKCLDLHHDHKDLAVPAPKNMRRVPQGVLGQIGAGEDLDPTAV